MQTLRVVSLLAFSIALAACGGSTASSGSSNDNNSQGNNPEGNNPNANAPSLPAGSWTTVTAPIGGDLVGIWGSAANDIWAVGENGIIHYDGTKWITAVSNAPDALFSAVWGSGANDVYAVGMTPGPQEFASTIDHWDGSQWTQVPGLPGNDLWAVWGSSANDVWAAGDYANGDGLNAQLLHFDGTSWTQAYTDLNAAGFFGVWGSSASDVYAFSDAGAVHYDGTKWSPVAIGSQITRFGRATGTSANDVWVTATEGVDGAGEIFHFDGSTWTNTYSSTTNSFAALWSADTSNVWAVGTLNDPTALREEAEVAFGNGSAWGTSTPQTDASELAGVWGNSASDIWIVGTGGTILHYH